MLLSRKIYPIWPQLQWKRIISRLSAIRICFRDTVRRFVIFSSRSFFCRWEIKMMLNDATQQRMDRGEGKGWTGWRVLWKSWWKKKTVGDITACPTRRTYNFRPDVGSSSTCAPCTRPFAKRGTAVFSARQFVCVKAAYKPNERTNERTRTYHRGIKPLRAERGHSFFPFSQFTGQRNRDNFSFLHLSIFRKKKRIVSLRALIFKKIIRKTQISFRMYPFVSFYLTRKNHRDLPARGIRQNVFLSNWQAY